MTEVNRSNMTEDKTDERPKLEETREQLNRIYKMDAINEYPNLPMVIESYAQAIAVSGTMMPSAKAYAGYSLSWKERILGKKEIDISPILSTGIMIGAALERDLPGESEEAEQWRENGAELEKFVESVMQHQGKFKAVCGDCDWEGELSSFNKAADEMKSHAQAQDHETLVEQSEETVKQSTNNSVL